MIVEGFIKVQAINGVFYKFNYQQVYCYDEVVDVRNKRCCVVLNTGEVVMLREPASSFERRLRSMEYRR